MERYDVGVIGGGPGGLSAALYLGRARRRVLLVDGGAPRNRAAAAAHGVFTRDHTPPEALVGLGRSDLSRYPTVRLRQTIAETVRREGAGFRLELADGTTALARRVILATGVRDELPPVRGLTELWGTGVFHCPYCDGWEMRDARLAIYARGLTAMEMVPQLLGWSRDVVLCTDGPAELADADREALHRHGVPVLETAVGGLEGRHRLERIVFADGTTLARDAMFLHPPQEQASPLAASLGCQLTAHGLIEVDHTGRTTVPGVYAAGDAASRVQQVIAAAASGAVAGIAVNHELALSDFAADPSPAGVNE